jgi:adenylate cyclase
MAQTFRLNNEEGTLARLKAHRRELINPKTAEHGGRIVKASADGLLVEFASVVGALSCATEVRAAASRTTTSLATGSTSRLGSKAWSNRAAFASRLGCKRTSPASSTSPFMDIGDQQLKKIARPVRV